MSESKPTPKPWHWGSGWQDFDKKPWKNEEFAGPKHSDIGLYDADGNPIIPLRIDHYEIEWDSIDGLADLQAKHRRLIAAAPVNAELAGTGLKLAKAVLALDAETCCRPIVSKWQEIVLLARCLVWSLMTSADER